MAEIASAFFNNALASISGARIYGKPPKNILGFKTERHHVVLIKSHLRAKEKLTFESRSHHLVSDHWSGFPEDRFFRVIL
jgi:hypothetical protein